MRKIIIVLLIMFLFFGCVSGPQVTQKQRANADYGIYPNDYKELIKEYWNRRLIDPYSARYQFYKPFKVHVKTIGLYGQTTREDSGYLIVMMLNAKNRMGGYVGRKEQKMFIKNKEVLHLSNYDLWTK